MRRGESVAIPPEGDAAMGPSLAIWGVGVVEVWDLVFCRGGGVRGGGGLEGEGNNTDFIS